MTKHPFSSRCRTTILVEHMRSVDWVARNLEKICPAPQKVIQEVVEKLGLIIG